MISSAYGRAIEWQIAENDPVRASKSPKVRKKPKGLYYCQANRKRSSHRKFHVGACCLPRTGRRDWARRGALLALRRSDLDGNAVFIGRSLSQTRQGLFFKECKSGNERTVSLPASAMRALASQRESQLPYRGHFVDGYQSDLDFLQPRWFASQAGLRLRRRFVALSQAQA